MKQGWRRCGVTTNYAFFPAVVPTTLQDGQAFVNDNKEHFSQQEYKNIIVICKKARILTDERQPDS